jgi:tetratricopeptide (TPR) repeat protein/CHAT domain-containing protein
MTIKRPEQQIDDLNEQVESLYEQEKYEEAVEPARQACELATQVFGADHPVSARSLNNLGMLLSELGDLEEARSFLERALEIRRRDPEDDNAGVAASLNNLGMLVRKLGDLKAARFYHEEALDISLRVLGEEHSTTTIILANLGGLLSAMGDLTAAKPHLERALEIRRRTLGDDHSATRSSLNSFGLLLSEMGNLAEARPLLEQALEICRRVFGDEHPNTCTSLNNLGVLWLEMGDLQAARPYLEKALEIRQRTLGDDHPNTAASFSGVGMLLLGLGDLKGAQPYIERALEVRRRVLGDEHVDTAESFNNVAFLLLKMGNLEAARPYLERFLEIYLRVGGDHPNTATALNNIGMILHEMGNLAEARPCLEQALEIRQRVLGNDHPDIAGSCSGLGTLFMEMGDWVTALPYLAAAVTVARKALGDEHPDTASCISNLGMLLREMGDTAAARPLLEQALEIRRRILGDDHPDTAISLDNLAYLFITTDDLTVVRHYLEKAYETRVRVFGSDHPDIGLSLNNIGMLLNEMGDREAARQYLEKSLDLRRRVLGDHHPLTAATFVNLAMVEVGLGRIGEGFALMRQGLAIDDFMIGHIFSFGSDQQRLLFLGQLQSNQDICLSLVSRHLAHSPDATRMALDLVLRRKALGAEALAAQRDAIFGGRHPHLGETCEQLAQLRRRTAQKMLAGPASGETPAVHAQILYQWYLEQQKYETALAQQIPEMSLEQQRQKADRRAVALALPEGVVLVEFVRFDVFDFHAKLAQGERRWKPARYLAFVLPARLPEQVQMIDLCEADLIDQMIADFRSVITTPPQERPSRGQPQRDIHFEELADPQTPPLALPPAAADLRQRVFDPLLPALGSHIQLWLSPDGDLARLPFEVLPDREEGKLLLDNYRISYLTTGRDVFRCGQPGKPRSTPDDVVAADPDFDLSVRSVSAERSVPPETRHSRDAERADPVKRLKGTRLEGECIATLLTVEPLLGEAVMDKPLKAIRSPRILHLATHGFFFSDQQIDRAKTWSAVGAVDRLAGSRFENPMLRSGLLLAGFNTWRSGGEPPAEAEDGMLTAEDVTSMDLLDTELVVLSACETGLGLVHVGEGVFGLRRAFAVAGAKRLVMSLWKVPDDQTQELMIDFYQRILRGEGCAEALRQAQQAIRARYSDPYYWGAFICQGDPGPLRTLPTG